MRVLLLTDWAPLEGGTERYVAILRDGLRRSGDDVALLTSSAGSRAEGTAEFVAHGSRTRVGRAFTQVANPLAARTVRDAVREFRPDVVHTHMFASFLSASAAAAVGETPVILTVHDYTAIPWVPSSRRPQGALRQPRDHLRAKRLRKVLGRGAHILTISAWMQQVLEGAGLASEVVPLPIPRPRKRSHRAAQPVLVYGGRLDPEKGVDHLLAAFALLAGSYPEAELRIYGAGSQETLVENSAAQDARITLIRGMDRTWWDDADDAWAVVVPSVWDEPFGLVAAEAIIRGIPVIATSSGGLRETVRHGRTGVLVPRGDAGALAESLAAVCSGGPAWTQPGAADIEALAGRHDTDTHVRRLREVYAKACAS